MLEIVRREPTAAVLASYCWISSTYEVSSRAEPEALKRSVIVPLPVAAPYTRSLDDEDPSQWPILYDLGRWALFIASEAGVVLGACSVLRAVRSRYMPFQRHEPLLWDIRVSPGHRGRGAGKSLIEAAGTWALDKGCHQILIETQDTNVPACRLYQSAGATVCYLRPGAYKEHPDDVLVVWRLELR